MAIIQSGGALSPFGFIQPAPAPVVAPPMLRYHTAAFSTYEQIYRRQPNVRTVIDFLARNLAQLKFHPYRRVSDTDRQRLPQTHPLVQWLMKPNPSMTRYRLFEATMLDYCIFWAAYWLKVRRPSDGMLTALLRLPAQAVWPGPDGALFPTQFLVTWPHGGQQLFPAEELVYFSGYDPCNPLLGISPLETLRRTLAEEQSASAYRAAYWENAARIEGVIERPATAKTWTPEQKASFREQWQGRFGGPRNAGQTAVLEDGMTFKATSFSAKDSEYIDARKLTREECASAYHVPLPMVGILDHATFSNVREQHKQLYQDTLGPYCSQIAEEIERQVVPECDDPENIYLEANIAEKLKGSFEEQAASIQTLTGRPVVTPNESRARLNLPAITDDPTADQLARPLNYTSGPATSPPNDDGDIEPTALSAAETTVIERAWARQRQRLTRIPVDARAQLFDQARYDRELADDLAIAYRAAGADALTASRRGALRAQAVNSDTLALLVAREDAWSPARDAALYTGARLEGVITR
jgi:HK97 family phage portal protein